jgi:ABC-type cobalt transport system substrate-binding protein
MIVLFERELGELEKVFCTLQERIGAYVVLYCFGANERLFDKRIGGGRYSEWILDC